MTRMRTTILAVATLLVLLLGVLPASAQDYSETGGYLILGGLNGFEHFPENGEGKGVVTNLENSMGFQIRAGVRILEFLAAEIEGDFLSGFDFDARNAGGTPNPLALTYEGGNITANVKGYLPFGRIQPYAMVGVGGMWANVVTQFNTGYICGGFYYWCTGTRTRLADGGAFVAKFGGGADFWITEDWALMIDVAYTLPTGELADFAYTTLGWGVKFKL